MGSECCSEKPSEVMPGFVTSHDYYPGKWPEDDPKL